MCVLQFVFCNTHFLVSGGFGREQLLLQGFDISGEALVVENHAQQEGQGSHQHIHRDNHPEPGPILDLTCEFAHRNGAEELGGEQGQEFADGIVGAGAPDVRGVLVANAEEVILIPQGDEAQLRLEQLVEHDEQHQKQQSGGGTKEPAVGQLVMTEQNHQQGNGKDHPVVIVKTDNVQLLAILVSFCHGLLGIEQGNQTAEHTNVEHIVLNLVVFRQEQDGEQGNVGTADIDKPAVPQHSCFVHGVGRDVHLQKMKQQTKCQQGEQHALLHHDTAVSQKVVKSCSGTGCQQKPEEVPAIEHRDKHIAQAPFQIFLTFYTCVEGMSTAKPRLMAKCVILLDLPEIRGYNLCTLHKMEGRYGKLETFDCSAA